MEPIPSIPEIMSREKFWAILVEFGTGPAFVRLHGPKNLVLHGKREGFAHVDFADHLVALR